MGVFNSGWESLQTVLLKEILQQEKLQTVLLKEIKTYLGGIIAPDVKGFTIQQTGDTMPLALPDPGNTLQFTATPTPPGSALPAGVVPVWTSSDTANVTITTDPTGLIATVVLGTGIAVGESLVLTVTADYTSANTGQPVSAVSTLTVTIGAPPAPDVTGFTIVQTA